MVAKKSAQKMSLPCGFKYCMRIFKGLLNNGNYKLIQFIKIDDGIVIFLDMG
jgi:hypothetical protein